MSNSAFTPSVLTISAPSTGSGQGELNVISNPSAVTDLSGWTATGLTPSRDTSGSPLDPTVPTGFSLSASASGQTYISTVTVPSSLRNRKLKLEFYFSQSTASYKVDVLNSSSVRFPLTTDVSSVSNIPAISGGSKYTTYFDMDSGSTISVRFSSIASSGVLKFTQLIVGPGIQPQGAVVGEWTSYTPTWAGFGSKVIGTNRGYYRRIGSNLELMFAVSGNNVASGGGASEITLSLPPGLTTNTSVTGAGDAGNFGAVQTWGITSSGVYDYTTQAINGATPGLVRFTKPGTNAFYTTADLNVARAIQFEGVLSIPIAEWAGSGTVQLAQNDVEWAWNSSTSTTSDTTSFGYGPQGVSVQSFAPSGTNAVSKRVRFQTPIQSSDVLTLEIQDGSGLWVPYANRSFGYASNEAATVLIGANINVINSTDVDVNFYSRYSWLSAWSAVSTFKWRLRKSSAGAAVGFGIVQPGVSSGLVSASGLPGNTTGSAIAAGYVGEVLTATWTGQTITSSATTLGTISNVQPGIYIVIAKCDGSKGTSTRTVGIYGGTSTYIESGAGFGGVEYLQAQDTTSIQANFSTTIRVTAAGTFTFASQVITGTSNVTSARGCLILVRIA